MSQNSVGTYNRLIKLFSKSDSNKTPLEMNGQKLNS